MIRGSIKEGSPSVSIKIGGVFSDQPQEFEAIVDTGFTGFVSMPFIKAFPLGLPLYGSTSVVLADGKSQARLIAEAQVVVGSDSQIGLVILEPSSNEILVGMDFLRHFKPALILASYGLALIQESEFDKIVAEP